MQRRLAITVSILLACFGLNACSPQEPIRIGLLAGLSDRGSDFGESVRNSVILAVEQRNQAGGINGRKIELIVRDDGQDSDKAVKATQELIDLRPEIVIGPVTSSMAKIAVPMMEQAGLTVISPTVASTDFYGKDDNLFRVNRTTGQAAEDHANFLYQRGVRSAALAFDASNLPYSETWTKSFIRHFQSLGGRVTATASFESSATPRFAEVVGKLLASRPQILLFVASSLDTARLCQAARRQAPDIALTSTEWAASGELLVEMGGTAVEGLLIAHAYDRTDPRPAFQNFRSSYKQRFQREFGSFSLLAFDTANIVFDAMSKRSKGESMKSALLAYGPYQGTQQEIRFDANGDAKREVFFTEIRDGKFVQVR